MKVVASSKCCLQRVWFRRERKPRVEITSVQRITVAFFVIPDGGKISKTIAIWRSKKRNVFD